ncbi:MAG: MAPEG family protein [Pseudomonadota bacterium]
MGERRRILIGMGIGSLATGLVILAGPILQWLPVQPANFEERAPIWAVSAALPLMWLAIAIARVAQQRFSNDEDLDPLMGRATARITSLNQQLQNTLEQAVLAIGAYSIWSVLASAEWGNLTLWCAVLFSVGRLLFFIGYANGAANRALGFALTFYPTIGLILCSVWAGYLQVAG